MPFKFRINRWWIVVPLAAVFLLALLLISVRSYEPVYQGRRLGSWLRGHPNEYRPAVFALGTNALPYLLAELQARDSKLSQWGQRVLTKASIGPFWRTARDRQYHARLGLQILDTNAVPALLEMAFAQPMADDSTVAGLVAVNMLVSTQAHQMVEARLVRALGGSNSDECWNACLMIPFGPFSSDALARALAATCRNADPKVRAGALHAIRFFAWREETFLPPLISCLEDEHASVRGLAIKALSVRGANAVGALPALHAAYSNELVKPNLRDAIGDGALGRHPRSAQEIRWAIRDAIRAIDPSAPPLVDPP